MKVKLDSEDRLLLVALYHEHALSYKEILVALGPNPIKGIHGRLDRLVEVRYAAYGPSTWEGGVSVRTWVITNEGKLAIAMPDELKEKLKEKPVAQQQETIQPEPREEQPELLSMFDDAVKVMRASIEASLATPTFQGDIQMHIGTLKKYQQVAIAMGDNEGQAHFHNLMGLLERL